MLLFSFLLFMIFMLPFVEGSGIFNLLLSYFEWMKATLSQRFSFSRSNYDNNNFTTGFWQNGLANQGILCCRGVLSPQQPYKKVFFHLCSSYIHPWSCMSLKMLHGGALLYPVAGEAHWDCHFSWYMFFNFGFCLSLCSCCHSHTRFKLLIILSCPHLV